MGKIVRKLYMDYGKEEAWLNAMAAKGLALTHYSWCRYVFEETDPGKYIYRIELLGKKPSDPESAAYLRFIEGTGVEIVSTYLRWVYLRRKASEGSFDLYSDVASKLAHGRRVTALYTTLMLIELAAGSPNVVLSVTLHGDHVSSMNLFIGLLCIALGVVFLTRLLLPQLRRMKRLSREQGIRE